MEETLPASWTEDKTGKKKTLLLVTKKSRTMFMVFSNNGRVIK
jgi:hypothetical protein